jgi:aminoglycoside phosphotransferase (APT) family kinase protein
MGTAPSFGEKLGEGREAEVFACGDGKVLRLMRNPDHGWRLDREAAAITAATAAGAPVPAAYERVVVDGRPGLVMERVEGPDLLTMLSAQPWRVVQVGRMLGEIHARLHSVSAPGGLARLSDQTRERIESGTQLGLSPPLDEHLVRSATSTLDGLGDGDALCHGDFNPANVLLGRSGPSVIDWVSASAGDRHGDVARTRLLLSIGEPPPGTSPIINALDRVGRPLLLASYMRAYARVLALDRARLERWEVVRAAERLAFEYIPQEERALRALLEKRLATSR